MAEPEPDPEADDGVRARLAKADSGVAEPALARREKEGVVLSLGRVWERTFEPGVLGVGLCVRCEKEEEDGSGLARRLP